MMSLWPFLIKRRFPRMCRFEDTPPLPDPTPGPEYHQAMADAQAARDRAERILATYSEPKPTPARPA